MNTTQSERIKHYEALSDGAKDSAQAISVSEAAILDDNLFVYGELLSHEALKNHLPEWHLRKLGVFAHGMISREVCDEYKFCEQAERKLRMLTLISVLEGQSQIGYDEMREKLMVDSDADLELVVRDAMSIGLIRAKMDQRQRLVEVSMCTGRDVDHDRKLRDMLDVLHTWLDRTQHLIHSLDNRIQYVGAETVKATQHSKQVSDHAAAIRKRMTGGGGSRNRGGASGDIMTGMRKFASESMHNTGGNGSGGGGIMAMDMDDDDEIMNNAHNHNANARRRGTMSSSRSTRSRSRFEVFE